MSRKPCKCDHREGMHIGPVGCVTTIRERDMDGALHDRRCPCMVFRPTELGWLSLLMSGAEESVARARMVED